MIFCYLFVTFIYDLDFFMILVCHVFMTDEVRGLSGRQLRKALRERALEKARQQELAAVGAEAAITRRRAADKEREAAVANERVALAVLARLFGGAAHAHAMLSETLGPQACQEYGLGVKTIEAAERAADGEKVDAAVQEITGRPAEERQSRRRGARRADDASEEAGTTDTPPVLAPVRAGATQEPQADDRLGALGGWPAGGQEPG
ncbi:hypothetical protein [Planomonospora sphaerica]|uniref:hypothetical protein n=1 Tax=Planomonospora sphaerica TaxID=161355 RepID=UPI0012906091|nr:hypothetical protein [Planomonospora sphaerica]